MNLLARQFFTGNKEALFKQVLFLEETPNLKWDEVVRKAPRLPRGWFELSRVAPRDRVEFIRDFWLDRMPYHPSAHPAFFDFFEQLDDVGIVLTQVSEEMPMEAELIYSLADNSSFFRGKPPARDEAIYEMKNEIDINLPYDYLAFLRIHNGFGKLSEMGVLEAEGLAHAKRRVMDLLLQASKRVKSGEIDVDPGSLIPFYEALGLSSFQCFYTDWYPGSEMGNVYLSGIDYTLSDVSDKKGWTENLAFPTFSEWLAHYLQGMDLCT
jgi:hypothetical protein